MSFNLNIQSSHNNTSPNNPMICFSCIAKLGGGFNSCIGTERHVRLIHFSGPETPNNCDGETCGSLDG